MRRKLLAILATLTLVVGMGCMASCSLFDKGNNSSENPNKPGPGATPSVNVGETDKWENDDWFIDAD